VGSEQASLPDEKSHNVEQSKEGCRPESWSIVLQLTEEYNTRGTGT
jgi:hypothetical protein